MLRFSHFVVNECIGGKDMKRYEYKCVYIFGGGEKTTRILNEYGNQGWDLISTWWAWFYFKRKIEE